MATTVVFSGGPSPGEEVAAVLAVALGSGSRTPDRVIAADGGLEACLAAGLEPDVVVGDMDSVASADLSRAEVAGVRIERHPRDKDAVDLELALDAALRASGSGTPIPPTAPGGRTGPTPARARLVVIGSAGGRLDHLVASMLLLGSPRYRGFEVEGYLGSQRIVPVHDTRALEEPVGTPVSLLALHGAGSRVTTSGLRWPLARHELVPSSSLGVSNEFAEQQAHIEVSGPPVTVILPGRTEDLSTDTIRHGHGAGDGERPEVVPHD